MPFLHYKSTNIILKIIYKIGRVGVTERVEGTSGDEFYSGFATSQYDLRKDPLSLEFCFFIYKGIVIVSKGLFSLENSDFIDTEHLWRQISEDEIESV